MQPLLWVPYILLTFPLWIMGLFIVAFLLATGQYHTRPSRVYKGRKVTTWKPRWAWLWGQEEDGVFGPDSYRKGQPQWLRAYVWAAIRNPVNNERFTPPLGFVVDPSKIKVYGNTVSSPYDDEAAEQVMRFRWSYVTHGWYSGLWIRIPVGKKHINFRIGWKLLPRDKEGVPDYDYRKPGVGFGLQLQLRPSKFPNDDRS